MLETVRTFRVFISSTFLDLRAERDILQRTAFPQLMELCASHGSRFQPIDLRWGISEEASLDQRTLSLCLDEIARCQQLSPRPNFIVLLGQRYGWRPPPPHIGDTDFRSMLDQLGIDDRRLLTHWYRRDRNAVPSVWDLRPRTGRFVDSATWQNVEWQLASVIREAAARAGISDRLAYVSSAVEQEIAAALAVVGAATHVYAFIRTIDGLPRDAATANFYEADPSAGVAAERLRDEVRRRLSNHVYEYRTGWAGTRPSDAHLPRLAEDVYQALAGVIRNELSYLEHIEPFERELAAHQSFARQLLSLPTGPSHPPNDRSGFVGRTAALDRIAEYLLADDPRPLAVFSDGGVGKSTLVARAAELARARWPQATVVVRFVGASPNSVDARMLLHDLCLQLVQVVGHGRAARSDDYPSLVIEFQRWLTTAGERGPLLVFIDALDQLSDEHYARSLGWLPRVLPPGVRLVVSTRPGTSLERLRAMGATLVELAPMALAEGEGLLDRWLSDAGRTLQRNQRKRVMTAFAASGQPLHLRLIFEQARRWHSHNWPGPLPKDVPGTIARLYRELGRAVNHGTVLVHHVLGLLAASRFGLSEDELVDLLSTSRAVMAAVRARSHPEWTTDLDRLPVVLWSRLRSDLQPYLTERGLDQALLLDFYHGELRQAAQQHHLTGADGRQRHAEIATMLGKHDNLRQLRELPYHLTLARRWGALQHTLSDRDFLDRKSAAFGAEPLLEDFLRAYDAATDHERLRDGLARTLARIAMSDGDGLAQTLDATSLHALLAYRDDRRLYQRILQVCTRDQFAVRHVPNHSTRRRRLLEFRTNAANIYRRLGGPDNLDRATQTLQSAVVTAGAEAARAPTPEMLRVLATIEYELGYLDFLTGRWRSAIQRLERSAATGIRAGDQTAGYISRCVAGSIGFYAQVVTDEQFRALLHQALQHFQSVANTSLLAERWVMNVHAHLFDVAFLTGDRTQAIAELALLQGNSWLAQFGSAKGAMATVEARGCLLRGEWSQAAGRYQELLAVELNRPEGPSSQEQLARTFLEYGTALASDQRISQARVIWEIGLRCPDDAGNWPWKPRIERALRNHPP
jgi:hypothetical protein